MPSFPRKGGFRVLPERNLREIDPVANRVGLSQTEDRAPAQTCALLQGHLITKNNDGTDRLILAAATTTAIYHRLGRQLVGWFVTRVGGTPPFAYPTEISADDTTLVLFNPGTATPVDLWVF